MSAAERLPHYNPERELFFMPPSQTAPLGESLYPAGQAHRAPQDSSTHTWLQPPLFSEHVRPAGGERRHRHATASHHLQSGSSLQHCGPSEPYRRLSAHRCRLSSASVRHTSLQQIDTSRQDNVCRPHHTELSETTTAELLLTSTLWFTN